MSTKSDLISLETPSGRLITVFTEVGHCMGLTNGQKISERQEAMVGMVQAVYALNEIKREWNSPDKEP